MARERFPDSKFTGFSGINNVKDPAELEHDELADGVNIDLSDKGKPRRRRGHTLKNSGIYKNLWSSSYNGAKEGFVQKGETLYRLTRQDDSLVEDVVRTGMQAGQHISYLQHAGITYYTNGIVKGRVVNGVNKPWGVEVPAGIPTLASTTGSLPPGIYQVAVTFLDDDGLESGASLAASITLAGTGGITVSAIPTNGTNIDSVRVYVTGTNGDTLYHDKTVSHGTTSTKLTGGINTVPLSTQFLSEPPAGSHIARTEEGRMYIVVDNGIFITQPFRYHLVDLVRDWLPFEDTINMVGAVDDGIYVSADAIYWVGSTDGTGIPTRNHVADDTAIPGTLAYIDGKDLKNSAAGQWFYFHGQKGMYLCGPGGNINNLALDRVAYNPADSGAAMVRENNGILQHLALHINSASQGGNFHASDLAEAEIIRNGINITNPVITITYGRVTSTGDVRVTSSGDRRISLST